AGLGMGGTVTYGTVETLTIELGSGSDSFVVESTHSGTTTVSTGEGADEVNVQTVGGATSILVGAGDDVVAVGNAGLLDGIATNLVVEGGDGNDTLTL